MAKSKDEFTQAYSHITSLYGKHMQEIDPSVWDKLSASEIQSSLTAESNVSGRVGDMVLYPGLRRAVILKRNLRGVWDDIPDEAFHINLLQPLMEPWPDEKRGDRNAVTRQAVEPPSWRASDVYGPRPLRVRHAPLLAVRHSNMAPFFGIDDRTKGDRAFAVYADIWFDLASDNVDMQSDAELCEVAYQLGMDGDAESRALLRPLAHYVVGSQTLTVPSLKR